MTVSSFFRFFPPPAYLFGGAAGLDLSDRSLKFMQLKWRAGSLTVAKFGEQALPAGIIEAGKIKDEHQLVPALKKLAAEHQLKNVACDVPEEDAYVFRLKLPMVKKADLPPLVAAELPERVPLPADAVLYDYQPLPKSANKKWQVVDVAAARRETVESYCRALKAAGLTPMSFELEGAALTRALVPESDPRTILIIDLGKIRTGFYLTARGALLDTATITGISGDAFTEAVRRGLNLELPAAESLKIRNGLSRAGSSEQFFALVPLVSALADEIKKRERFWREHGGPETGTEPVAAVILAGGQASLPGLAEYLTANTNLPVTVADPWSETFSLAEQLPPLALNEALRFTTAIGLALKVFKSKL